MKKGEPMLPPSDAVGAWKSGGHGGLGIELTLGVEGGVVVDVALLDLAGVAGAPNCW